MTFFMNFSRLFATMESAGEIPVGTLERLRTAQSKNDKQWRANFLRAKRVMRKKASKALIAYGALLFL